jgi:hypothetical protein
MPQLLATRVSLSLVVGIPPAVFERHLPSSPRLVGHLLAEAVAQYEQSHELGYYPALDFFLDQGGLDPELLNAAENIAWLGSSLVREEIRVRLRGVFANVKIQSIQCLAFAMPTVRPHNPRAIDQLAEHYTPDRIKLDLLVTLFRKESTAEGMDRMARNMIHHWLKDSFDFLEITSATLV